MSALARARAVWVRHVDAQAEAARLAWITPGAGQAAIYLLKREEAARYLAAAEPDPAAYPLLSAELGITAGTLLDVAQTVAVMAAQWIEIAAQIETIRLGAKAAITAAETIDAVIAAASVTYPQPP